jgi:hypothetical protein
VNDSNSQPPRVDLDWSSLLGFDQVNRTPDAARIRIGAKAGLKPVAPAQPGMARIGAKVGQKTVTSQGQFARIGAKVGFKTGPRS